MNVSFGSSFIIPNNTKGKALMKKMENATQDYCQANQIPNNPQFEQVVLTGPEAIAFHNIYGNTEGTEAKQDVVRTFSQHALDLRPYLGK